jgi:hypothetical protein
MTETREDAYARQDYDADCNDCVHFQRSAVDRKEQKPHIFGHPGTCVKHNKPATAHPNKFSGHPCYESRRTGMKSTHNASVEILTLPSMEWRKSMGINHGG